MSEHSPRPVADSERIARFVFSPIHVGKKGNLKPSLFSHVDEKGCSVQRDSIASDQELLALVQTFLNSRADYVWMGVVIGSCQEIRKVLAPGHWFVAKRTVCVYDTAEPDNPAHAEICRTCRIQEADRAELRAKLLRIFGDGTMTDRQVYRAGNVWNALPPALRARTITSQ
jgi:hypothetical protein